MGRTINRPIERANFRFQGTPKSMPGNFQQAERKSLTQRTHLKCFKCNQIGRVSSQCRNFQTPSQHPRPPAVHNVETRNIETETHDETTKDQEKFQELTPRQANFSQYDLTQELDI